MSSSLVFYLIYNKYIVFFSFYIFYDFDLPKIWPKTYNLEGMFQGFHLVIGDRLNATRRETALWEMD